MQGSDEQVEGTHALWHPFADMGAVDGDRLILTRGEGVWVWDDSDRRYFDGTAALWYSNLGHGRPEIARAIKEQMQRLDAYSIFGDFANEPALELADRLAELAPTPESRVFLGSGGGDMIDTAAKVARRFHVLNGQPDRVHLIGRTNGYHGTHGVGTSVGGIEANLAGFGPLVGDRSSVPHDDAAALEAEILALGPENVAAFFCEPVIGAGGVILPQPGYIEDVAAICRRHGVLFVADCVICGFGRLGTWLGIDRWPVEPDLITLAKGVSNGAQPVGALIVAPDVAAPFFTGEAGAPVLRHGATYAGHPVACAAANAALDVYEREGVIERGRELESKLADVLAPLSDSSMVAEVRAGLGLLAGVELDPELLANDPSVVIRWQAACREEGVLIRPLGRGIAVSPPLVSTEEHLEFLGCGIAKGLDRLARSATTNTP